MVFSIPIKLGIIILVSIMTAFGTQVSTDHVLAISFDRQEIDDDRNDWIFWPATKEAQDILSNDGNVISIDTAQTSFDKSQCNIKNQIIPEIYSVSYTSDDNRINSTIWTSERLLESILLRNGINENNLNGSGPLPSWNRVKYTMVLDIFSTFDRGIDYRIDLVGDMVNPSQTEWKKEIYEISADGTNKLVLNESYSSFPFRNMPFVEFSDDLRYFGNPDQYRMLFYITDQYLQNGILCRIVDSTNWVLSPPPQFNIITSTNTLSMRPGEDENILVTISGDTNLESKARLFINNTDRKLANVAFVSNETIISSLNNGTSILHIGIPQDLKLDQPKHLIIPITSNISFLPNITSKDGETFYNNQSISLLESSSIVLTRSLA